MVYGIETAVLAGLNQEVARLNFYLLHQRQPVHSAKQHHTRGGGAAVGQGAISTEDGLTF